MSHAQTLSINGVPAETGIPFNSLSHGGPLTLAKSGLHNPVTHTITAKAPMTTQVLFEYFRKGTSGCHMTSRLKTRKQAFISSQNHRSRPGR